ncbi:tetratricopeptide repeat protein [Alteribacter populi]|uniref:tetratricopeptide repeat protein n=1 Tax=Alteribacter populi TaxID=2011011 RepID=UPI000BBB29FF|nr:tetratricopeptide repeat protein [Alteribacter populi]
MQQHSATWEEKCAWFTDHYHKLSKAEQEEIYSELEREHLELLDIWSTQHDLLATVQEALSIKQEKWVFSNPTCLTKGIGYFQLEMYSHAIENLEAELPSSDQKVRLMLYIGFACLYEEQEERAKDAFLTVYQQGLDKVEKHFALLGLGLLEGRQEKMEEAIVIFEKALTLINHSDVLYNLGTCYYVIEKYDQASQCFLRVAQEEPEPEVFYWLGKSLLNQGNVTKAYEIWYETLEAATTAEIIVSLAYEFEERGEFVCALHCYQKLSALGFEDCWVIHGLAWNLGLLDKRLEAKALFERALKDHPEQTNVWISYLWLLSKWGWSEEQEKAIHTLGEQKINHPLLAEVQKVQEE